VARITQVLLVIVALEQTIALILRHVVKKQHTPTPILVLHMVEKHLLVRFITLVLQTVVAPVVIFVLTLTFVVE